LIPEFSKWELIEEERQRFESTVAVRMGMAPRDVKKLRTDDSYGDRYSINLGWYYWLVAVGLLQATPDLPGNEHSIVDDHGQPFPKDP